MSLPILHDLYDDLKRLTIAGSDLAIGDMSLKKKPPVLTKMGEKAPVFSRLAALTNALAEAEGSKPDQLLELSQLLSSVMYTMGKSGKEGDIVVEAIDREYPAGLSYHKLQPILVALTTKGSGRVEIIQHAEQSGNLFDIRLIRPLMAALDDSYSELADYVAEKVLPMYGRDILPTIQNTFQLKGKKGDGRRLKVIHSLLKEEGLDFYIECVEKGSEHVRNAAIDFLYPYDDAEEIIMEAAKSKKVETRRAAYASLAKRDSDAAAQFLMTALEGKDRELVVQAAMGYSSPKVKESLLEFAKMLFNSFVNMKKQETANLLYSVLGCFQPVPNEKVLAFLRECVENREISVSIARTAAVILYNEGFEMLRYIESICTLPHRSSLVDLSFRASLKIRTKEEVFDLYSRYAKRTRKDPAGQAILETMDRLVFFSPELRAFDEVYQKSHYWYYGGESIDHEGLTEVEWDERWVDLLIKLDEEKLVYRLPHQITSRKHLNYLLGKLAENPYFSSSRGMGAMTSLIQIRYEDVFAVMVDTLKKTDVNMSSVKFHYSSIVNNLGLFAFLPKKYAEPLKQIAEQEIQHQNLKDRLQEIYFYLKNKGEN